MIQERIEIEGSYESVINPGATATVGWGSAQIAVSMDCRRTPFWHFGHFFDKIIKLDLFGSLDNAAFFNFDSLTIAANTYASVYSWVPPADQDGIYVIPWPYLQVKLTNIDAAPSSVQRFYMALTSYRG
jgi:hypothetical protein